MKYLTIRQRALIAILIVLAALSLACLACDESGTYPGAGDKCPAGTSYSADTAGPGATRTKGTSCSSS